MSVLNLYYSTTSNPWRLIPGKLFKIDSIAEYLATKSKLTINNFQYIKNNLEISIKVDMSQANSQPLNSTGFKYVSITNTNERVAYYYVKRAIWRSANTVQFDLVMDVLNTLVEGSDYVFKANTKIIREHKDRYGIIEYNRLTLYFDYYDYGGSLNVGYSINFKYEGGGSTFPICEGTIVAFDESNKTITISYDANTYTREEIESLIAIPGRHFLVERRDATSNYLYFQELTDYRFAGSYYRNIDYVSENINPLLENKQSVKVINPKTLLEQNWYLLYRNQNDPTESLLNPVECYLIPEKETLVNAANVSAGRVPINAFTTGVHYCIRILYNTSNVIGLDSGVTIGAPSESYLVRLIFIDRDSNDKLVINVYDCDNVDPTNSVPALRGTYESSYITLNVVPQEYGVLASVPPLISTNMINAYNNSTKYNWTNTALNTILSSIDSLDKTDAKNIKLIKLPYVPYNFILDNSNLRIDLSNNTDWLYTSFIQPSSSMIALKLKNLNTKLSSSFNPLLNPLTNLASNIPITASIYDLRKTNLSIESKLYHSEFYKETFVYDSFSWYMSLEKLDINSYKDEQSRKMNLKFNVTSTINSKFLFTFTPFVSNRSNENYPNVLPVARNNEEVLYNVPYINYVRTGYNYDIKAKNMSEASNWIGIGLSGASIGASLLFPSVPLKVAGVVASVVSFANSVKSSITTTLQNEEGLKQKILQAQNQASSVVGSNDVDLMSEYSGNRLTWMRYEPNDIMKNLLFDLFFYAGYNSGRMGLPNHNTRCNFDYLECEAVLETEGANLSDDIINELKNCFKVGVTYIHKTNRSTNIWDIEQKYENWENNLI